MKTTTENNYTLTIAPLDEQMASLIKIDGLQERDSIFHRLGRYEGHNYYVTPKEISIYEWPLNGIVYKISKIQKCSFSHCSNVNTIFIGPWVDAIDWNMYHCSSLENIFVDNRNPKFRDINGVLFEDWKLIAFPQGRTGHYDVPFGTKVIGNHAFKSSHISSITFPVTIQEIGINSFYDCKYIKELILPDSIKKIHMNHNQGFSPITQTFYLMSDKEKINPLTIEDLVKMFPV